MMNRILLNVNKKIEHKLKNSGYYRKNNIIERIIDVLISLAVLCLSAPVLIILAVLIKIQDRGPIFYRGIRYGLNKQEFYMYKFRTLVPDAEARIGAQLLSSSMDLATPLGILLRDTRLDELPQMLNVLKGDMSIIGPRPERPAIYESMCKDIPNYEQRFLVKPGVIGYSQLFTPHSASKKLRAKIDNYYSSRKPNAMNSFIFIVYSLIFLGIIALNKVVKVILKKGMLYMQVKRLSDYRASPRIKFGVSYQARLLISHQSEGENLSLLADNCFNSFIFDINDKYISIISDYSLPSIEGNSKCTAKLVIHSADHLFERRKRRHVIRCNITSIEEVMHRDYHDSYRYILAYTIESDLYRYRMDKYILKKSIL